MLFPFAEQWYGTMDETLFWLGRKTNAGASSARVTFNF